MFLEFGMKDLVDILLVAYLLYQSYRLMKDSGTINIFHRHIGIYRNLARCLPSIGNETIGFHPR